MEKGVADNGERGLRKVVITGPESTGKTTLAEQLARSFGTVWVPEYARGFVRNLGREYDYQDIEHIGRRQIEELTAQYRGANQLVFFDTGLIITRVWFLEGYQTCPVFIDRAIREITIDLYLLCRTDIEWVNDPVREHSGLDRERLFSRYRDELIRYGASYSMIEGRGENRLHNALQALQEAFGFSTGNASARR
jgi:NadR type nicotinamide-nucleotide adenylyltransferase